MDYVTYLRMLLKGADAFTVDVFTVDGFASTQAGLISVDSLGLRVDSEDTGDTFFPWSAVSRVELRMLP